MEAHMLVTNQLCIDGVGLRTLWDTDDLKEKDGIILYFPIGNQSDRNSHFY